MGMGYLTVRVFLGEIALPLRGAAVYIKDRNGGLLYKLETDRFGRADRVALEAPDADGRDDRDGCVFIVEVYPGEGFAKAEIQGVRVYDEVSGVLPVRAYPEVRGYEPEPVLLQGSVFGGYDENGEAVFPERFPGAVKAVGYGVAEARVPAYVTVRVDGTDGKRRDVRVPFVDYVKNAARARVRPWWKSAALYACIYDLAGFVAGRAQSGLYRSFDVTDGLNGDPAFVWGADVPDAISRAADKAFGVFIRPGSEARELTAYAARDMAELGYTPLQIIRRLVSEDAELYEPPGLPETLGRGADGESVRRLQSYLREIGGLYGLPEVSALNRPSGTCGVDEGEWAGFYGPETEEAVEAFQKAAGMLDADGTAGKALWSELIQVAQAARRLEAARREWRKAASAYAPEGLGAFSSANLSGGLLAPLSLAQVKAMLNYVSCFWPDVPHTPEEGGAEEALAAFGLAVGLEGEGVYDALLSAVTSLESVLPERHAHEEPERAYGEAGAGQGLTLMFAALLMAEFFRQHN